MCWDSSTALARVVRWGSSTAVDGACVGVYEGDVLGFFEGDKLYVRKQCL